MYQHLEVDQALFVDCRTIVIWLNELGEQGWQAVGNMR